MAIEIPNTEVIPRLSSSDFGAPNQEVFRGFGQPSTKSDRHFQYSPEWLGCDFFWVDVPIEIVKPGSFRFLRWKLCGGKQYAFVEFTVEHPSSDDVRAYAYLALAGAGT